MEKLTWNQMLGKIYKHNDENHITQQFEDNNPLHCVVVYKSSNWPKNNFTLESRSYEFRSDNKYFLSSMGGNSIFGDCLDKSETGVRLDWYDWEIEYCYIK